MLASRALSLLRTSSVHFGRLSKNPLKIQSRQGSDHSMGVYRDKPKPQPFWETAADCVGGFMWWWILWHCWTDMDHLIGHYPYPEPSEWTDEELGIPPDDQVYEKFDPDRCIVPPGFYDRK